jgi:hypothetical protein
MKVELVFHLERVEDDEMSWCWWIETHQAPELAALADTVAEARRLALEALEADYGPIEVVAERLYTDAVPGEAGSRTASLALQVAA